MSAHASLSRVYRHSEDEIRAAVQHALNLMDARDVQWLHGGKATSAKLRMNFWSFGERLQIAITEGGKVTAQSECVMPTQVFDWKKNQRNLSVLFEHVSEYLGEGRVSPAFPPGMPKVDSGFRCVTCGTDIPPFERSSTTWVGWCVFIILIFVFFPLCWLGLFI